MNLPGLTDSVANLVQEPVKCAGCGGVSRLANGLCLSCLLQAGLDPRDESCQESFASVLSKIDIHDRDWRIGHYEILEEIARGGMGVIYRARHQFSRRVVALKRVLSYYSDSPQTLARFRREAEAASLLDHPNILPIYEVGESADGLPFIAMKFATGGSLRDVRTALQRMPNRIVPLILSVARAVHSAHMQGILHRDLKPGNILLDGRGEPLVSDFGLAKWLDASNDLTRTLTIFGTPGYIAPEQARGPAGRLGPAADIYSLGAILFDLLAGRPPFVGEHALAVISQASEKSAPRLRTLAPSIDRDLETICARCLEGDPSNRYASAADLADDLERRLGGHSIRARPVSAPVQFWRWTRRNPTLAAFSAACLLLTWLSWANFSQNHQFQAARRSDVAGLHSVMVLPFLDLDNAVANDEIAREVATALRSDMSKIGPCRVVQNENPDLTLAAVPRVEEVAVAARQAKVRTVLKGTKRLVNGEPVYAIQLVDPAQPNAVLSNSTIVSADARTLYDFIQRNAPKFYNLIGANAPVPTRPRNRTASDFMAAGRTLMDRRTTTDCDRAIECFEKAIAADPSSAEAYAFLAIARTGRSFLGGRPELAQLAEASAQKAVALDPQSALAHRALSFVLEQKGDLVNAREEALRAIGLNGIDERSAGHVASFTKTLGRPDLALRWLRIMKHLQVQPGNESVIGDCLADLCEDERAEEAYHQTLELHPDLPDGWAGLCRLRMLKRDFAGAAKLWSKNEKNFSHFDFTPQMAAKLHFFSRNFGEAKRIYAELALKDSQGGGKFYGAISYQSALGFLELKTGRKEAGQNILDVALQHELDQLATSPRHPEILYRTAAIEAALALKNSALVHLRAAAIEGWIDFRSLALDPRFDALRDDAVFKEISESMMTRVASLRRSMPTDLKGEKKGSLK
jgi:serine/threonine protein kinase/tetratricopeptide (TPR) repeat protein